MKTFSSVYAFLLYMKPSLNLRQIEAFRSVMLAGSVVGAAKLLNVTQPGVSRAIGLLEQRLKYALFERRGRRLVPTPEAETLYREVEQVYGGIDRIAQVAEDIRHQRIGVLRIATLPALAQWLVPACISRFLSTRLDVNVFVQSLPSLQIAELVSRRQFDIGIVEMPVNRPGIEVEQLEPIDFSAVLPNGHRLAASRAISMKEFDGERMVLLSQHSFVRYKIDDALSQHGVTPRVVIETPSSSIACALAAAGAGITLVPRWTAEEYSSSGVAIRPLKEPLSSQYALIFPQIAARLTLATAFADELRAFIKPVSRKSGK
ncbi:LysR substrate-binding domain-containing protein [Ferrovibrio sp.]|uniref:LysR substrate-binding domain-containing protein n=1 Tax=Ferrovibrio sp. TaxID=1917215 RepID=UPI002611FA40|nr:LysR substrate-binding domain-containing protein [Ferrovibrio sp.]